VHGRYDPYAQDLPEMLETPELLKAAAHATRVRSEVGADAAADVSADDGAPTVNEVNYG
jgi:hypothetical protein